MKPATLTTVAAVLTLAACGDPATPIPHQALGVGAPQAVLTVADGEVVMSGLHNPRGLAFGPDGALFVAEAGTGGTGPCVILVATPYCYGPTGSISGGADSAPDERSAAICGNSLAPISSPSARTTARKIAFSSWRTLPGQ